MNHLCIIPCGSKKIWDKNPNAGPTIARNVYIGPFALKCKDYAELFHPGSWCILSAKYGFLLPQDVIVGPYNVSFNDAKTNPITAEDLSQQAKTKGFGTFDTITVLGGKTYVNRAKEVFPGASFYLPLSNCKGIGYMMQKLNNAILARCPFSY